MGMKLEDYGEKKQWTLEVKKGVVCGGCGQEIPDREVVLFCKGEEKIICASCDKQDPYFLHCRAVKSINHVRTINHEHYKVMVIHGS